MTMIVKKRPGESDESLIARFRRQIQAEKVLNQLKDLQFYKSPSTAKAEKMAPVRRAKRRGRRR